MKKTCTTKLTFTTLDKVFNRILYNYKHDLDSLGYYECPSCLDFHLTSKYDNRPLELRVRCLMPIWSRKKRHDRRTAVQNITKERMNRMYREMGLTTTGHKKILKVETLSFIEQQKALQKLRCA